VRTKLTTVTWLGLANLVQVLLLSVLILILVWPINPSPSVFQWQDEHPYTIIEIKAWVDVNGTYGFEPIALVRMLPLNSDAEPEGYNWMHSPFKLDNRYGYEFTAPPEMHGKKFLFWQSEKTWEINPNRTLILRPGFSSDLWWMNYG